MLTSCSEDKTIKIFKIFNIKNNIYWLLHILDNHKKEVLKIIELNNKKLVSCLEDWSIIIYYKDYNNKYIKEYNINTNG